MEIIRQPEDSTVCGQCSLAMVTNSSYDDMIDFIGNTDPMNLDLFTEALNSLRYCYRVRIYTEQEGYFQAYNGRGILRVAMADDRYGNGHAVAYSNGVIYDPQNGLFENVIEMCQKYLEATGEVWMIDYNITVERRMDV